jgi:hypothetical protein
MFERTARLNSILVGVKWRQLNIGGCQMSVIDLGATGIGAVADLGWPNILFSSY